MRLLFFAGVALALLQSGTGVRRLTWADLAPLHKALEFRGITPSSFSAYVESVREENARRVREGDLDHLVFYLLQSTRFTGLPPIEPALSAKALVDGLEPTERKQFQRDPATAHSHVPGPVRARIVALLQALQRPTGDVRLGYFHDLVNTAFADPRTREPALAREYLRVMRFVHEKEFVAPRSPDATHAVASLYESRGLSTDTAVEAGYVVHLGLAIVKSLAPEWRARRALIVGPGLDLAPRMALDEEGPPQSYQPWAVIDALVGLELSKIDELTVVAADINPRVVEHLRRSAADPPVLTLVSELRDSAHLTMTEDYRSYFARLGTAVGEVTRTPEILRKAVRIRPEQARPLRSAQLDIVTERLADGGFDVIVATNILPYFDDVELMLALSNVASMLAPGGVFLHNTPRPAIGEIAETLGLRFEQSRHATIATVKGGRPLGDSVFLHRRIAEREGLNR